MSKYLDIEKLEYSDKIIEIDDDIAEAILELNKKGYTTFSSCAGHSQIEFYPCYLPIDEKDKINPKTHIIFDESDTTVYSVLPSISTYCYIKFDKGYNFNSIPKGFEYETANQAYNSYLEWIERQPDAKNDSIVFGDSISRRIDFFDENDKRRPFEDIDKEIKEANKDLLDWVKQLEPINEKESTNKR